MACQATAGGPPGAYRRGVPEALTQIRSRHGARQRAVTPDGPGTSQAGRTRWRITVSAGTLAGAGTDRDRVLGAALGRAADPCPLESPRGGPQRFRCDPGPRSFAVDRFREHGDLPGHRGATGVGAGPEQFPGTAAPACPGDPSPGAAAGGRRGRAAAGVRADRVPRPVPGLLVRPDHPVHPPGRGDGRDLRGHALPHHHRRGGAPIRGSGLRGSSGDAGRETDDRVPPGHRADGRPLPGRGRGAVLGPGASSRKAHRRTLPASRPPSTSPSSSA
jgi:hypothetical protein